MALKWISVGVLAAASGSILGIYFWRRRILGRQLSKKRKTCPSEKGGESVTDLQLSKNTTGTLTLEGAKVLSSLVASNYSLELRQKALITIAHSAAIFHNHLVLQESGCMQELSKFVRLFATAGPDRWCQALDEYRLIETALTAINNLANKEENLCHLQDCIGSLLVIASAEGNSLPEGMRSAALKALINFTCTDKCFSCFTAQDVQMLLNLTGSKVSPDLRLQSLKLLVNLSVNCDVTPYLLASTVPDSFFSDIDVKSSEDRLLRWLTILRNVIANGRKMNVGKDKTSSCEKPTLYEIFLNNRQVLRSKLHELTSHSDDNIRGLAFQLIVCLSAFTGS